MEISVDEKEYCKLDVRCEADAELVDKKFNEVARLYKTAHVPGFRPGKATIEAVKTFYRKQIGDNVKQSLAREAFDNLIAEKSVKPIGQPNFSKIDLLGEKFVCEFSINKMPDFELGNYKEFEINRPTQKSTIDELTEQVLIELSRQNGDSIPFSEEDVVSIGDNIILSYETTLDGNKHENLSSSADNLIVGQSGIDDFDANLVGMKMGESKSFDINVPHNGLPSLAGKTVTINATVLFASKITPHPIDDALAAKLGKVSLEDLKQEAHDMAVSRINDSDRNEMLKVVQQKLNDEHDFKVPEWLSIAEAKFMVSKSGANWDALSEQDRSRYLQDASKGLKVSMVLDKIRENEPDAQLSDEEVVNAVKVLVEKSGMSYEKDIEKLSSNGTLGMLVSRVKEEHTLEFVLKTCTILDS